MNSNVFIKIPKLLAVFFTCCGTWSAFLARKDSNNISSHVVGMSISLMMLPTDRRT